MTLNELCKHHHRAIFLALQGDCKTYPGGISALAGMIGLNPTGLADQINPDNDKKPPSFSTVLELITTTGGNRTMVALCRLTGQVPFAMVLKQRSQEEAIQLFLAFVKTASEALMSGSEYAADGRFSGKEKDDLERLLSNVIRGASELMQAVRS
jgi:DNA-binding phage protein